MQDSPIPIPELTHDPTVVVLDVGRVIDGSSVGVGMVGRPYVKHGVVALPLAARLSQPLPLEWLKLAVAGADASNWNTPPEALLLTPVIDSPHRALGPKFGITSDTYPPPGYGATPFRLLPPPSFSPVSPTYPVTGVALGRVASAKLKASPCRAP